jgi:hypothetical protein
MVAKRTKEINTCNAARKSWFQRQMSQGGGSKSIADDCE